MKNVLIIGANSALAKSTIKSLTPNYKITTAGRNNCDLTVDIGNEFEIPENIDIIINFAASFGYVSDDETIGKDISTNILGTFNILKAAKKANLQHLILLSSIYTKLPTESPFFNSYSLTKKQADQLAQYYCKINNMNLTILKPSQIYGMIDDFKKNQPLFYVMLDRAQCGEDISIYGTNDAIRNYINSEDLSLVIKKIIEQKVYGEFDCIHPNSNTLSEIASTIQNVFGKGGQVQFLKDKPDIPDNDFEFDDTLYKKIDFHPQVTLTQGVEKIKNYRLEESK